MEEARFTFESFTYANKAKKILAGVNVRSKLIKLGVQETGTECTHGLAVSQKDFFTAVKTFREHEIKYRVLNN